MSYHHAKVTVKPEGVLAVWFTCTAPVGAKCRLRCIVRECDGDCSPLHEQIDGGECHILSWLENDPEPFMGLTDDLSFDVDIRPIWNGDGYEWALYEELEDRP